MQCNDLRMDDALWQRSAGELAYLIRSGQVSSREVVQAHLDRIEEVNASVNAVTVTLADEALAAADEADRVRGTGPFHGVPFTIKENIDCVGSPTTQGVPALADALPAGRRADRRAHEGRRRHPVGADQPSRVRLAHLDRQPAARPHEQSLAPPSEPRAGRVEAKAPRWPPG